MTNSLDPIHVVVAMDFSDSIIEDIRAVSPRLKVERHHPTVPDRAWAEAEIMYTLKTFPTLAQAPRLRWIQLHSAGVERALRKEIVQAEDVEVTTTSGIHAVPMTEFCIMMITAFNYKLPQVLTLQAKAEWPPDPREIFAPTELRGQTLGIVGYGNIGRELARVADAMGMTVLAMKRDVMHPADDDSWREPNTGDPEGEIPRRLYPPEAIQSMAKDCDYLVIAAPATDATKYLIDADVLAVMKKSSVLINVARGSLVNEADLISALAAGKIAGAALDVFEEEPLPTTSPLWNLENVIIAPHISGNTERYHEKAAGVFIDNLTRYLENRPLLNRLKRDRGY
jgi:phosphoglycerate dehydrogenase-like enzyme